MTRYKIAQDKRREITRRYIETPITYEELAEELGVSPSTVAFSIRSIDPQAYRKKRQMVTIISNGFDDSRKVPKQDYLKLARRYIETDLTYQDLGDEYGVSRERIRQIIAEVEPNAHDKKMDEAQRREEIEEQGEFIEACLDALLENKVCVVCGAWVIRKRAKLTCSVECSEAWSVLRTLPEIDGGDHRLSVARAVLRHPNGYSPEQIEHAIEVLEGKPPARRRYLQQGSKRAEVVRKYRPQLYDQLTGEQA